jgi:four helix bundle protein
VTETFRNLIAWQKAKALARKLYVASNDFPKEEAYGLTIQMRRAAVSIPSNIAER